MCLLGQQRLTSTVRAASSAMPSQRERYGLLNSGAPPHARVNNDAKYQRIVKARKPRTEPGNCQRGIVRIEPLELGERSSDGGAGVHALNLTTSSTAVAPITLTIFFAMREDVVNNKQGSLRAVTSANFIAHLIFACACQLHIDNLVSHCWRQTSKQHFPGHAKRKNTRARQSNAWTP